MSRPVSSSPCLPAEFKELSVTADRTLLTILSGVRRLKMGLRVGRHDATTPTPISTYVQTIAFVSTPEAVGKKFGMIRIVF